MEKDLMISTLLVDRQHSIKVKLSDLIGSVNFMRTELFQTSTGNCPTCPIYHFEIAIENVLCLAICK